MIQLTKGEIVSTTNNNTYKLSVEFYDRNGDRDVDTYIETDDIEALKIVINTIHTICNTASFYDTLEYKSIFCIEDLEESDLKEEPLKSLCKGKRNKLKFVKDFLVKNYNPLGIVIYNPLSDGGGLLSPYNYSLTCDEIQGDKIITYSINIEYTYFYQKI